MSREPGLFHRKGTENENRLEKLIDRTTVIRMTTVSISPKFQVVIPQRIRQQMGLKSGEKVKMISFQNRIEIIPQREMSRMRGYLKGIDTHFEREGDRL